MNLTATYFKGLRSTKPVKTMEVQEILEEIKSDKYRDAILEIRKDATPSKSPLKDKLPCFTPTGVFNHRSIAGLESYNGLICLDIDHVENLDELKKRVSALNYVYAAFVTPSGNGLKVMVKTNGTVENYKTTEQCVASAIMNDTGGIRDNHCKDIARIQFVSYDPELYFNPHSITF